MITIRQERVTDYATIGELHARAFGNRAIESTIVALLRQRLFCHCTHSQHRQRLLVMRTVLRKMHAWPAPLAPAGLTITWPLCNVGNDHQVV